MAALSRLGLSTLGTFNRNKIGQTVAKMSQFLHFSRWRPSAILDLFSTSMDQQQSIYGVVIGVQNLFGIHAAVSIQQEFEYFMHLD